MSFSMNYNDTDKLEVFLGKLEIDCKASGDSIRKESAKVIKARVEGELNRIRSRINRAGYKHMADDVRIVTGKDEFGGTVTKVQGGKKTGTKWHLVNDGTYGGQNATHFMDKALKAAEPELEAIIDKELSKLGD